MKSKYFLLPSIIALIFYYLTCFRIFTWWDSSEYSLAALTIGVPHPPGSLITVLIGWVITRIPLGIDKFFMLNLAASVMAAAVVYLVGRIALYLLAERTEEPIDSIFITLSVAIAALFLGLTHTLWYYAIRFTPYTTTALLTSLILFAIIIWTRKSQDSNSHLYFGLVLLLFGLDFSVHRTNLLMLPSILLWLALFNPRGFISPKYYIYGGLGMILGLAVQLVNIPLASGLPFLNSNNPDTLSKFWDYITLKQYGGGWLINMFPRKAPFFASQLTDYLGDFGANFANSTLPPIGYLPLALGCAGLILLIRKSWKLGLGLTVMFIFSSLGAILYFNLAQDFFRSIDRHYMPSFVIFGLFVIYGAGAIIQYLSQKNNLIRQAGLITILALILLLPIQALKRNYGLVDGSRSTFAYDTAHNFIDNLPSQAILYTQSDIDTYPLWCLQVTEKCRTDVTVCNMSLMNTPWFFEQVLANDKEYPYRPEKIEIESFSVIPCQDSAISIMLPPEMQSMLHESDFIHFKLPPISGANYLMVADQILCNTILTNNWKRPICFSTMLPDQSLQWLKSHLRLDGLYYQLLPEVSEKENIAVLDANLTQRYRYDGYADSKLAKEEPTRWVGWNYCSSFVTLASMQISSGDTTGCSGTIARLKTVIDAEGIGTPQPLLEAIDNVCK